MAKTAKQPKTTLEIFKPARIQKMIIQKFTPFAKIRKSAFFCAAKKVCEILQKAEFEAYFVGGCVRDLKGDLTPYRKGILGKTVAAEILK